MTSEFDGGDSETVAYAIPKKLAKSSSRKEIDTMLGTLQSDMTAHGVDTAAKGVCPACKKAIAGQVVTALGATWHPEHFTCVSCNLQLSHQTFFERDGRPYCEKDYHDLFSPRCSYCNGPVLDVSNKQSTTYEKNLYLNYSMVLAARKNDGCGVD